MSTLPASSGLSWAQGPQASADQRTFPGRYRYDKSAKEYRLA